MKRTLLIGSCAALLSAGVALAQTPPGEGQPGPGGPDRMMMMRQMHHHGWQRGTRFEFRKGDAEMSVSCSPEEPVTACVNGATTLLDKLNANKPAAQ